jgi:hypothetical protein
MACPRPDLGPGTQLTGKAVRTWHEGVGNDVSLFRRTELLEVFHQHDSGFTWHKAGEEN